MDRPGNPGEKSSGGIEDLHDRADNPAIDAQRGAGGGGGLRRADVDDHVGHLLDLGETADQRRRPVLLDELSLQALGGNTPLARQLADELGHALGRVGPGNTALTVTPVPATVSASPRETASWAVLVIP